MRSVVCVGGLHVDAKARVLGPVVTGSSNPVTVSRTPGGVACNVARTLVRLGVPVSLVSLVGDDDAGRTLRGRVAGEGIDVTGVAVLPGVATASYTAVLDASGALVMGLADMAIYDHLGPDRVAAALSAASPGTLWMAEANLGPGALAPLAAVAERLHLDPVSVAKAPRLAGVLAGSALFPDAAEATALTGRKDPVRAAEALRTVGARRVVVTLGPAGVFDDITGTTRAAVRPDRVVDVTGAGDALLAGYLAGLAHGAPDPLGWGLAAASLAVETVETVPDGISVAAVEERLARERRT